MELDFLIKYLLNERGEDSSYVDSLILEEKEKLYRGLVNIRDPKEISNEYLKAEDKYLKSKLINVTDSSSIKCLDGTNIAFWLGDITKLKVDAIVNAGNSGGTGCYLPNHNCIDNQINTFAGVRLRLACNEIMKKLRFNLETGKAIISKGYNLPCKYVIETVGPIFEGILNNKIKEELSLCYINSLKLAVKNNIRSIAFPCISTGVFGFPKKDASIIAINTVKEFLKDNDKIDKVIFSLYSKEDLDIYESNFK